MGKNTWIWIALAVGAYYLYTQHQSATPLVCAPGYVPYTNPTTGQTMCVLAPTT